MRHYLMALTGVVLAVALLMPFHEHLNSTTIALCLLLVVQFVARQYGSRPALAVSFVAAISFNYFFLPPLYTLTIADAENWIALAAFLVTSVTVGELSARARRRADEAEYGKAEIERLYLELREAFKKASHAEALKQSEKLKSALLDAVTHDIRTPLTAIKASVTTLLNDERALRLNAAERREMLEVIDEESDRLTHFITGLIDMARIEAGKIQLRSLWEPIGEIIGNAIKRAVNLTRHHEVTTEIDKDLPLMRVDPRAIEEVIFTLLDNAAKYSPPGTMIRLEAGLEDEDRIRVSVSDQGPGIPLELREKVFEKFYRPEVQGRRQPAGTGLGLAIAKGLVEAHAGKIYLEDADGGKGLKVVMILPIGDDAASEATSPGNSACQHGI
jgi:two-component system sensor histidine kinase KdpD